jgi:hypothetical protein
MRIQCRARWLLTGLLLLSAACTSQVSGQGVLAAGATPLVPSLVPTPMVGSCPGAKATTRPRPAKDAIVKASPDHLPLTPALSGPQSVRSVALSMRDVGPEATEKLYAARLRDGYLNVWQKGAPGAPGFRVESVSVLTFADSVGSCAWADFLARTYQLRPAAGSDTPGLVEEQPTPPDSHVRAARFVAVKGLMVIDCGVVQFSTGEVTAVARSLFDTQYEAV